MLDWSDPEEAALRAIESMPRDGQARSKFISHFGFVVPSRKLVARLLPLCPLVEVGAGTGALARCISEAGGDIIATDPGFTYAQAPDWYGRHFPVEPLTATDAIKTFPGRNILCAWPDYLGTWPVSMLLEVCSGIKLAYVGEGHGGCTADDAFHRALDRWFTLQAKHKILTFEFYTNDRLCIYEREVDMVRKSI